MKKDKTTIRAKREGYKARSVYKLFAINNKYRLIKKGDRVLDLGCWPGSWLQACLRFKAFVVGVDLRKTEIDGAETIIGDVTEGSVLEKIESYGEFDVVISDMAPNTSGRLDLDTLRSYELSARAFVIAERVLKKNGNFLVKVFQSRYTDDLYSTVRKKFSFAKIYKPQTSKKRSKEIYIVACGYKG